MHMKITILLVLFLIASCNARFFSFGARFPVTRTVRFSSSSFQPPKLDFSSVILSGARFPGNRVSGIPFSPPQNPGFRLPGARNPGELADIPGVLKTRDPPSGVLKIEDLPRSQNPAVLEESRNSVNLPGGQNSRVLPISLKPEEIPMALRPIDLPVALESGNLHQSLKPGNRPGTRKSGKSPEAKKKKDKAHDKKEDDAKDIAEDIAEEIAELLGNAESEEESEDVMKALTERPLDDHVGKPRRANDEHDDVAEDEAKDQKDNKSPSSINFSLHHLREISAYIDQIKRAMEKTFRQTEEGAPDVNGTYISETDDEIEVKGHKYHVHKSVIEASDNSSTVLIEAIESDAEKERKKRSNWFAEEADNAKSSDP